MTRAHEAGTMEAFDRSKLGREETPPGWGGNFFNRNGPMVGMFTIPSWSFTENQVIGARFLLQIVRVEENWPPTNAGTEA